MKLKRLIPILALLFIFSIGHSQNQFKAVPNAENSILIEGTSNIHDWEIVVKDFTSQIDVSMTGGELDQVNSINLSIPVKSFDSGKGRMDKNTYEALKEEKYQLVSFSSRTPAQLVEKSSGVYKTSIKGNLTISGTSKLLEIPIELHKTNNGYTLKAEQGLNMTDYKVDPPKALFGTITTGDAVNIIFNLTHYKL